MSVLFDVEAIPKVKARSINKEDKEDCLKLLHMVRDKYGIDAYLYFRNMLAVVVMKQKYDYKERWISLRKFIDRNFDNIPSCQIFNRIKSLNYATDRDREFFGISVESLKTSFYSTLIESTDYWIEHNGSN